MGTFKDALEWYQTKIGDHDKQGWEQNVEGKILRNIDSLPKRDFNHSEQNRELLDIDLIKGSTFTKAAPSHTSYVRTWNGLVRVLFLPIFYRWWVKHTTWKFFVLALLLYGAQVSVTFVYFGSTFSSTLRASLFEVTNPLMFMFVLSIIHTQIVYTQSSNKTHLYKKASVKAVAASNSGKRSNNSKRVKKSSAKVPSKPKTKIPSSIENRKVSDNIKNYSRASMCIKQCKENASFLFITYYMYMPHWIRSCKFICFIPHCVRSYLGRLI